ncbi:DNA polymerase III, subunit gamma/tau [Sanguibacter keddieii DSM 10542]|uniref:DNA-directed DNA polymerase n=1 Tax=Sanguibacter keddieii (strain ATCC 51767 / DSM 10542 / NCFB 3025 / ST-74) TaxID=446469 RepID=D1BKF6_SANKS|nr:DNA polymerase III subunit gamma and tau [Sanguibacter keddieii]ACZ20433.1 DNA polymerase III, subunit gamma/tau [Sanguibacter keddieii DSM 10542]
MSTALYRRYRPENFAEVIGQEHVTDPLRQALRSDRVNHAYLFSGPRGCGKTTSARILARILNCAKNTPETPTDTPCGECESCTELARGGPGSLDVVEIDAASHGGVDDARELRERATFSPSRDRFKIFILDEAHMVTAQGFNALLKIVEEPPEYLKFIFATTEPDKVIGTIRSRTHHYPFRLVAPETLQTYLGELCTSENITVGGGVLPLVVRAGGGSVRDSLSVLDQLMAGAESGVLDYERAVSLLGFTHVTLLDDVVEALAARDGASMFRVVDHVVATGHEPRRFVEDLLERLRDLIVLSVSGEAAQAVLRSVPADQLARMQAQATNLGAAELSRSADVVNAALTEMSGATSPRLHLELLCARLLLPAVDDTTTGIAARLDRLERGAVAGAPPVRAVEAAAYAPPAPAAPVAPQVAAPAVPAPVVTEPVAPAASAAEPAPVGVVRAPAEATDAPVAEPVEPTAPARPSGIPPWEDAPSAETSPAAAADAGAAAPSPEPVEAESPAPAETAPEPAVVTEPVAPAPPVTQPAPQAAAPPAAAPVSAAPVASPPAPQAAAQPEQGGHAAASAEMLRRRWPEVLDTLSRMKKSTWALIAQNAQVADLSDTTLRLTFASSGLATTFRNGPHAELVQRAVRETLGFDARVEGGIEEQSRPAAPAPSASAPARPAGPAGVDPAAAAASWDVPVSTVSAPAAPPVAAQPAPAAAAPSPQTASLPAATGAGAAPGRAGSPAGPPPERRGTAEEPPPGYGEEPPEDFDHGPEPVVDRGPARDQAPANGSAPARDAAPAVSGAAAPAGARTDASAVPGETPRQAAERRFAEERAAEEARAHVVDDPQPDDEDLASTGLVGVPLVTQILGGTIIDEIVDGQV